MTARPKVALIAGGEILGWSGCLIRVKWHGGLIA